MKAVAVMPAYVEESRIAQAILETRKFVETVIVVDDGSTDATVERAREAGAIVLRHAVNRGQGAALKTGTVAALRLGADVIVHVDADGQHDASFLPTLIAPILEGRTDVVFGSRFLGVEAQGMPRLRRMVLTAGRAFSHYLLGLPRTLTDPQSGLRALSAAAARNIDFRQDRMAHCSEILRLVTRSSWRWMEVPICVRYTTDTLAKGNKTSDAIKIVWQLFLGAFQR
jgi:glycosyltransferase involved in cell wall biosynthesis